MRKTCFILVITVIFIMFSGCSNRVSNETTVSNETNESNETTVSNTSNETTASNETTGLSQDQEIIDTFNTLVNSKPVDLLKISDFLVNNIKKISAQNADLMLQGYEKIQMQSLPSYQDAFFDPSVQSTLLTYSIEELQQNQVKETDLQKLLTDAVAVGYKIEAIEGTVAPYVDYGYYAQFGALTTESTSAFYALMKVESDNPSQKDGGLLISWDEVLQRGINFEAFLKTYPESYYYERVSMHFEAYQELALNGSINVPLFEYETNVMNDEAKTAYTFFVEKDMESEFAKLMKNYLTLLEKNNFIKTSEVESFIDLQK